MRAALKQSWLYPTLEPLVPAFRQLLVLSLAISVLALAPPVFVLQVYDRVVFYHGLSTLVGLVIGVFIALGFDFVLRQGRSRMLRSIALRIDVEVARRVFRKVLSLPLRTLESRPTEYWQSLFRDVDAIRNAFSGASLILLIDLPFALLYLAVIFAIATPVAWILLLALPVFVFMGWRSSQTLATANAEERRATQSRDTLVAELMAGRATVKALDLDAAVRPLWEERHANTIEESIARGSQGDRFWNTGMSLASTVTVLLTTVGALAILDQRLTIGALIATNMLGSRIVAPFNQLVAQYRSFAQTRHAVTRLGNLLEEAEEPQQSAVEPGRPKGAIVLEQVTFRYAQDASAVIDAIDLRLDPGGLHALIGPNGSGKTTLLKLLQGLYTPTSGRVLIDRADLAQFSRKQLARWFGYVPQDCFLFAGSLRDNISKGCPHASDEAIVSAATRAGLHSYAMELPKGYGTEVGEAGARLSGGFRQRVAIARALVGNPPVLLFDEPSSNLDRQAEEELAASLIELARDHTVVLVTHSPVMLNACHSVVALDRGRVASAGRSGEVLPRLLRSAPPPARRQSA